jgi:hypothetical protein
MKDIHSALGQILQVVDSTSATIIRRLLSQEIPPESLSTDRHVNPSETHNSSLGNIKQSSPLEVPYSHFKSEENASPSILHRRILPDEGRERGDMVLVSESATRSISHAQVLNYSVSKSVTYFRVYKPNKCEGNCECSCHSSYRYRTPLILRNLLCTLFIGYAGSPLLGSSCERIECQNQTKSYLQLTYCFPQWFLEKAIHVVAAMTYIGTATFGLEVRRRIGWGGGEDGILRFALTGNTIGIKSLLQSGKALMTDVDPYHGRSALYVSVLD